MRKWVDVFDTIFQEDNYTPITVTSEEEYQEVSTVYPFKDDALEQAPFPKSFPFSQFVPKVYCQVKEYIYACLKFSEDLHLRWAMNGVLVHVCQNDECLVKWNVSHRTITSYVGKLARVYVQ